MRRHIALALVAVLAAAALVAPPTARGQAILGPKGPLIKPEKPDEPPQPPPDGPTVFRLEVDAAPEPSPALKYTLTPPYLELQAGNAVPFYYRAVLWIQRWMHTRDREYYDRYSRWMETPPAELRREEVQEALTAFGPAYEQLRTAAWREEVRWDWRHRDVSGPKTYAFTLEEIQQSRELARLLVLKARVEIGERRYDDALETLRVGYRLARDVAEPPILITRLVGIAIASMMNEQLLELIGSPGSPNLYWAIAELPRPLIDMRGAIEHETLMIARAFPFLLEAETAQRSPDEWLRVVAEALKNYQMFDEGPPLETARMMAAGWIAMGYPQAKRELIEAGFDREQLEAMPVGQLVAIQQSREYREMTDAIRRWTFLPYHLARERMKKDEDRLFRPRRDSAAIPSITMLMMPANIQAMTAEARLTARFNGLMALEAVRMHAAANDGQLPQSLDEITVVPVPDNPITGEPFPYTVEEGTAILEAPMEHVQLGWRLEITIRRRE